ncbi:MAG: hypothetical protein Q9160_007960 [Pyrenula sp. 1 TL-2023]
MFHGLVWILVLVGNAVSFAKAFGDNALAAQTLHTTRSLKERDSQACSTRSPPLTTVTAANVVGTYALEAISSYANLKQSITTTVTVAITSSGRTTAEIQPVTVMAGGLAWVLKARSGDANAAGALKPPPIPAGPPSTGGCQPAPNKPTDDPSDNLLNILLHPPSKDPPDPSLGPETKVFRLYWRKCNQDATCLGIRDQQYKYKKCYCMDGPEFPPYVPPAYPDDQHIVSAFEKLSKVANSRNSVTCRDKTPSGIQDEYWEHIYPKFCAKASAQPKEPLQMMLHAADYNAGTSPPRVRQRFTRRAPSLLDKYVFSFEYPGENGDCKLSCPEAMKSLVKSCGTGGSDHDEMMTAATVDSGCGIYTVNIYEQKSTPSCQTGEKVPFEASSFML